MRSLRKATALLVAVAMIFSLCSFGVVFADDEIGFIAKADKNYVKPGETVTVQLYPTAAFEAANSSALEYTWDETKFSLKVVDKSGIYANGNTKGGMVRIFTGGGAMNPDTPVVAFEITVLDGVEMVHTHLKTRQITSRILQRLLLFLTL